MTVGHRPSGAARGLVIFLAVTGWMAVAPAGRGQPVTAMIRLRPAAGPPSSSIAVGGTGFLAGETVIIAFDQIPVGMATVGTQGRFGKSIMVPSSAVPGSHKVRARGRSSGLVAQAIFTVRTDWPMFRFSLERVGVNPYESVLGPSNVAGLAVDWASSLGGAIGSSPAVVDGSVYVGSDSPAFNALDASTGAPRWSVPVPLGAFSSPAVDGGVVYAQDDPGTIYAFDASTGDTLWTHGTFHGGATSPAVVNGVVYVSADRLYALDATTGGTIWTADIGPAGSASSPAVAGGRVFVGSFIGKVYAVDASTGTRVWASPFLGSTIEFSSPAVADGRVFIGTGGIPPDHLRALDQDTGEILWTATVGDDVDASPAVADGIVYAASQDGNLYAFDAVTGAELWRRNIDACYSSPTVANGVVYVGSAIETPDFDGKLWALDAATGAVLWSYDMGDYVCSSPTVADGRVYVGSFDGSLYAFELPEGFHPKDAAGA